MRFTPIEQPGFLEGLVRYFRWIPQGYPWLAPALHWAAGLALAGAVLWTGVEGAHALYAQFQPTVQLGPRAAGPRGEAPQAVAPGSENFEPYGIYILENVAPGGSVWIGQASQLEGRRTCEFLAGGLCADAGGADVPLQYRLAVGDGARSSSSTAWQRPRPPTARPSRRTRRSTGSLPTTRRRRSSAANTGSAPSPA
jgi:hypothetical protein